MLVYTGTLPVVDGSLRPPTSDLKRKKNHVNGTQFQI